jgi:hypothetical protein
VPARLDDPRSDGVEICAGIAAIGWQYYEGRSLTVDVQLDLDGDEWKINVSISVARALWPERAFESAGLTPA